MFQQVFFASCSVSCDDDVWALSKGNFQLWCSTPVWISGPFGHSAKTSSYGSSCLALCMPVSSSGCVGAWDVSKDLFQSWFLNAELQTAVRQLSQMLSRSFLPSCVAGVVRNSTIITWDVTGDCQQKKAHSSLAGGCPANSFGDCRDIIPSVRENMFQFWYFTSSVSLAHETRS